ncbi:ribokinase [Paludibacterium purpuratum]|uniref:Ribokinase n=1 Tax=Paludibacterium purpuratum TaxID=1144873 RepID=A0A4R7AVZ2_9NEIS|nr:ribokinase [Paludibacterium purpuratum]TDR71435.1 ribokinase [Paludibacterium purpuratum]
MPSTRFPSPHIAVVGSLNMDLVLRVSRCPAPGETLLGHDFAQHPGGKGANQAVACARLGAQVRMIGKLGNDAFAAPLRATLDAAGVDHRHVSTDTGASGIAMIVVEDNGQNRIMLAPGANGALTQADVRLAADDIHSAALLLCQLEVPTDCVRIAFAEARGAGVPILFNPAPAIPLDSDLLAVDYLVVNETEAALISGLPVTTRAEAMAAARRLLRGGAGAILLTLGADGALIADTNGVRHYPAQPAQVVDTTAAGDTFIGGMAAGLLEGMVIDDAVQLGMRAAALCIGRPGAQPSIPFRHELDDLTPGDPKPDTTRKS